MEARILAVGGGKGGTGKSVLLTQLGIGLAQMGQRVLLIDGDLTGPNLHTFFGLEDPEISFESLLEAVFPPERAVLPTGIERLGLVAGLRQDAFVPPSPPALADLFRRLRSIEAEVVLLDAGTGCTPWQLELFERADWGLLVTIPEPTCVEREYRFLRGLCRQRLSQEDIPESGWLPVPWLAALARNDSKKARALQQQLQQKQLLLVVNQARTLEDQALGEEMLLAARRFLGLSGQSLGWVEYDERLWLSIRRRRPAILEYPDSTLAEQLQILTLRLYRLLRGEEDEDEIHDPDEAKGEDR